MKEKWIALLQDKKYNKWILIAAVILLAAIVFFPEKKKEGMEENIPISETVDSSYEKEMEKRLEEILQKIEGAGKVEVMVSLKASEKLVIQEDKSVSEESMEEADGSGGTRISASYTEDSNTVFSDSVPFVVQSMEPIPEGVLILADGADSPKIVSQIHTALMALFDLPSHKIQVLKRKSGK